MSSPYLICPGVECLFSHKKISSHRKLPAQKPVVVSLSALPDGTESSSRICAELKLYNIALLLFLCLPVDVAVYFSTYFNGQLRINTQTESFAQKFCLRRKPLTEQYCIFNRRKHLSKSFYQKTEKQQQKD